MGVCCTAAVSGKQAHLSPHCRVFLGDTLHPQQAVFQLALKGTKRAPSASLGREVSKTMKATSRAEDVEVYV